MSTSTIAAASSVPAGSGGAVAGANPLVSMAAGMETTMTSSSLQQDGNGAGSNTGGKNQQQQQPTAADADDDLEEQQLSNDLALFLSNPSLQTALADGSLDLASYSTTVQTELRSLERDCIEVYRSKSQQTHELRQDVVNCQNVLSSLHEMLLGFQADLGGLSGDIRNLQDRSKTLDIQLRNRRSAESGLRAFLEKVVVSPNLAHCITSGNVDVNFLNAVRELNAIYKNCHETKVTDWCPDCPPCDAESCRELQAVSYKLRLVAVTRIREYFLEQMRLLRSPQTNIRMIQVHGLLRFAPLQDFLFEACSEIGNEIMSVYVESMSNKTILQLFRTYHQQLIQLDVTRMAATRHDVIAIEDAVLRDALATRAASTKSRSARHHHHHTSSSGGMGSGYDVFCLGRRAVDCLDQQGQGESPPGNSSSPIIIAHVAIAEGTRYPFEMLYKSLIQPLVDAVTNEHVFTRQFFQRDLFNALFPSTLELV